MSETGTQAKPSDEATKLAIAWIYGPVASAADSVNPRVVALAQFLDDAFAARDEQTRNHVEAGRKAALLCGEAEWCLTSVADEIDSDGPFSGSKFWREKAAQIQAGLDNARASGLLPKLIQD